MFEETAMDSISVNEMIISFCHTLSTLNPAQKKVWSTKCSKLELIRTLNNLNVVSQKPYMYMNIAANL